MHEEVNEISAGGVLIRFVNEKKEALLIKVRNYGYELPKGHLEEGETLEDAAKRELCEETSLMDEPKIVSFLGELDYTFRFGHKKIHKKVHYYLFLIDKPYPKFSKKPKNVREIKWILLSDLEKLPLVNEKLRDIIRKAFEYQ